MGNVHALLIDDNAQNLRVLSQLLSKQGVATTEVNDPTDIESLLPSLQPDVVFLDLEMPGSSGYEVREIIRSYYVDTPIIAYTVHISEINHAREVGFDGFLGKPLDTTRFPEQLARILRHEPVWERS